LHDAKLLLRKTEDVQTKDLSSGTIDRNRSIEQQLDCARVIDRIMRAADAFAAGVP
jgi:hypothetical protein